MLSVTAQLSDQGSFQYVTDVGYQVALKFELVLDSLKLSSACE